MALAACLGILTWTGLFSCKFLLSVKDSEEETRVLTVEEKKRYERQVDSYSIGYKYEPVKEKAVKINVKAMKTTAVEDITEKVAAVKIEDQPESEV